MAQPKIATLEALEVRRFCAAITGTIKTLASSGNVGEFTSVAIDPITQQPAVAYFDATRHDLKYLIEEGSQWIGSTVDAPGNVGLHASLEFDRSGDPWIAYYDATDHSLKLAHQAQRKWQTQTVDSGGSQGSFLSLALTKAGLPVIAYYGNTSAWGGGLKLATLTSNGWSIKAIDTTADLINIGDPGEYCSLALDGHDRPRIAYVSGSSAAVDYASFDGHAWQIQDVTQDSSIEIVDFIYGTHLVLDSAGNPHIAFITDAGMDMGGTFYATESKTGWNLLEADSAALPGQGFSDSSAVGLVFNLANKPIIAYRAFNTFADTITAPDNDLVVATLDDSSFSNVILDASQRVGGYISMATNTTGQIFIAYYDEVSGDLKLFQGS